MAGARRTHARLVGTVGAAAAAVLLIGCAAGPAPAPTPTATPSEAPVTEGPTTTAAIEHLGAAPCPPGTAEAFQAPSADGLLCGTLTVPLDHADPDGTALELEVALHDADAPSGVMLLLGGGPGGTSRWAAAILPLLLPEVAAEYQFVALDHRGTGADALHCPAVQAEVGSSDILSPSDAALADCAVLLDERAAHQSTADTIADLELLRETLGIEEWVLNGTSYGTFVAQQYALAHPAAVRALVLDSLVPAAGVDPLLVSSMTSVPRVLGEVCAAQECGFDPAAAIETVLATGYPTVDLLNALVGMSVMNPAYPGVLDALEDAAGGDTAALDELVGSTQAAAAAEPLERFSAGAHVATLCADTPMPWGGADTDPVTRSAPLQSAVDALDAAATWPFPVATAAQLGPVDACLRWPATTYRAPLTTDFPDVPVLILTGELDLSTPVTNAEDALATMPGAVSVVVPDAGHAAQMRPGGAAEVTEFLLSLDER